MEYEQQGGALERGEGSVDERKTDKQTNKKRNRKRGNVSADPQSDEQGPYKHIHRAVEGKNIEKPPAKDPFKSKREKLPRPPPLVRPL